MAEIRKTPLIEWKDGRTPETGTLALGSNIKTEVEQLYKNDEILDKKTNENAEKTKEHSTEIEKIHKNTEVLDKKANENTEEARKHSAEIEKLQSELKESRDREKELQKINHEILQEVEMLSLINIWDDKIEESQLKNNLENGKFYYFENLSFKGASLIKKMSANKEGLLMLKRENYYNGNYYSISNISLAFQKHNDLFFIGTRSGDPSGKKYIYKNGIEVSEVASRHFSLTEKNIDWYRQVGEILIKRYIYNGKAHLVENPYSDKERAFVIDFGANVSISSNLNYNGDFYFFVCSEGDSGNVIYEINLFIADRSLNWQKKSILNFRDKEKQQPEPIHSNVIMHDNKIYVLLSFSGGTLGRGSFIFSSSDYGNNWKREEIFYDFGYQNHIPPKKPMIYHSLIINNMLFLGLALSLGGISDVTFGFYEDQRFKKTCIVKSLPLDMGSTERMKTGEYRDLKIISILLNSACIKSDTCMILLINKQGYVKRKYLPRNFILFPHDGFFLFGSEAGYSIMNMDDSE